jgi:predicted alpha/beta hydrolase
MNHPIVAQPQTLTAADGYRLGAMLYAPPAAARGQIVVGAATGVPQRFYKRFAEHAAARGFATLTLDYRGIGLSKPATLVGFEMDYRDWARQDLAAAVEHMARDGLPLYLVGHSYGGQALGLMPNHTKVAGLYTFGTGAGWHGWMPLVERLRVQAMWHLVAPPLVAWKGYFAWSLLGLGEDLPLPVYRQWRRWCAKPRYFFDDPASSPQQLLVDFAAVRTPIVAANALDDLWALPASREAFMAAYTGSPVIARDLDPKLLGIGPIGHMGYFRPAAQPLWDEVLDWFEQLRVPRAAVA